MFSSFSLSLGISIGKIDKIEKSTQGDHAFIFDASLEYVNIFRLERFPLQDMKYMCNYADTWTVISGNNLTWKVLV